MAQRGRDLSRLQGQPMIGLGAEQRRRALDRIDPAHPAGGVVGTPRCRELPGIGQRSRRQRDQIAFDPEYQLRPRQIVHAIEGAAESLRVAALFGVAAQRFPLHPAHFGELALQIGHLPGKGRGGDGSGEQPQPLAAGRQQGLTAGEQRGDKPFPALDLSVADDRPRAARIVQGQQAGLHRRACRAEARRMQLVAFDFDRAPHRMLQQHALGVAFAGKRGRIIARDGRHEIGRLLDIGHELLRIGFGAAAGQRRQHHRRRHDLQEPAPVDPIERRPETRRLALDKLGEVRAVSQFLQSAPVVPPGSGHR